MKCVDYLDLRRTPWQAGDYVWACGFRLTADKMGVLYKQEPVFGMLSASRYEGSHDVMRGAGSPMQPKRTPRIRYFVPCRKGNRRDDLAWSKAVRVSARSYADTEQEAVEIYNEAIRNAADGLAERAGRLRAMMIGGVR